MDNITREIILKASKGDTGAFEKIYKAASGFVFNVALSFTGSYDMAAEVTQDTFIKVFENLGKFRLESGLKTWIYRITVNASLNAKKKYYRENGSMVDIDTVSDILPENGSVEEKVDRSHDSRELLELLDMLPENQRMSMILRNVKGLSYKEISSAMNTNINTVRTWLKRARQTLQGKALTEVKNEV